MSRPKRTIARDNVFRGTASPNETPQQGIETPEQLTRQTAVWLADAEVEWLDDRLQEIRRAGWRNVTRSALIRALIRAAMERSPELRGVSGEEELVARLLAHE